MMFKHGLGMLLVFALSGCASIYTVLDKNEKNKIYSGLGEHIRLKCVDFTCYDAPLSLALDTYLLPLTIPMTAYNYFWYVEKEPYDPTEDRLSSSNLDYELYISPTQQRGPNLPALTGSEFDGDPGGSDASDRLATAPETLPSGGESSPESSAPLQETDRPALDETDGVLSQEALDDLF